MKKLNLSFQKLNVLLPLALAGIFLLYIIAGLVRSNRVGEGSSIPRLKRVLRQNMFDYNAHFFLGRAYLTQQPLTDETLRKGIDCLHRAARLRGGKDVDMSSRILVLMLNHWERLGEKDRRLCTRQLEKIIQKISPETFDGILAAWEGHCRDVRLFENILDDSPQFFNPVANALGRLQIQMRRRQIFKLNNEIYMLEAIKNEYKEIASNDPELLTKLRDLHRRLKEHIPGYHKRIGDNRFKKRIYHDLLLRLDFQVLHLVLRGNNWKGQPVRQEDVEDFILDCIADCDSSEDYESLLQLLEHETYFDIDKNRLGPHYIRMLLKLRMQDYPGVINGADAIKPSLPALRRPSGRYFSGILLLQSEAFIASRLLTRALEVLDEIAAGAPDAPELYLQRMKIDDIIGSGEKEKKNMARYYRGLRQSRRILLDDFLYETDVFLVDNNQVEIRAGDGLKEKLKTCPTCHLLRVFVDGDIYTEVYLDNFKESVSVPVFPFKKFSRHRFKLVIINHIKPPAKGEKDSPDKKPGSTS